jgi:hypothetical protein
MNGPILQWKKQHFPMKKAFFRWISRFFSSSIRVTSEEAVFYW